MVFHCFLAREGTMCQDMSKQVAGTHGSCARGRLPQLASYANSLGRPGAERGCPEAGSGAHCLPPPACMFQEGLVRDRVRNILTYSLQPHLQGRPRTSLTCLSRMMALLLCLHASSSCHLQSFRHRTWREGNDLNLWLGLNGETLTCEQSAATFLGEAGV